MNQPLPTPNAPPAPLPGGLGWVVSLLERGLQIALSEFAVWLLVLGGWIMAFSVLLHFPSILGNAIEGYMQSTGSETAGVELISAGLGIFSSLLDFMFSGVFFAGVYQFIFLHLRGRPLDFMAVFDGFGAPLGQLILVNVVSGLIMAFFLLLGAAIWAVVLLLVLIGWGLSAMSVFENPAQMWAVGVPTMIGLFGLLPLLLLPYFYFLLAYSFAVPLAIERRMNFWAAMEMSRRTVHARLGSFFLLAVFSVLANLLGLLMCCVGIVLTMPLVFIFWSLAYKDVFGFRTDDAPAVPAV